MEILPSGLGEALVELDDTIEKLNVDEVHALLRIAKRLVHGRRSYGELHLASDPRDFAREAREEVEDALVYFACRWLVKEAP
jgi:hypothetical protein